MYYQTNLFQTSIPEEGKEIFTPLFSDNRIKIESIRSHLNEPGEWYDQTDDEWVVLLEGEALIEIEEKTLTLSRGDTLFLPQHTLHRVVKTSDDALWLTVFVTTGSETVNS